MHLTVKKTLRHRRPNDGGVRPPGIERMEGHRFHDAVRAAVAAEGVLGDSLEP